MLLDLHVLIADTDVCLPLKICVHRLSTGVLIYNAGYIEVISLN